MSHSAGQTIKSIPFLTLLVLANNPIDGTFCDVVPVFVYGPKNRISDLNSMYQHDPKTSVIEEQERALASHQSKSLGSMGRLFTSSFRRIILPLVTVISITALGIWFIDHIPSGKQLVASFGEPDTKDVAQLHAFQNTVGAYAPDVHDVAASIDSNKIFVVFKHKNQSNKIANEWKDYLTSIKVKNRVCFYGSYKKCKLHRNVIAIVDLKHTDQALLDKFSEKRSNLLAHGHPANPEEGTEILPGLTFTKSSSESSPGFAIVGDQELTLGLDAGLSFNLGSLDQELKAYSSNPQAISMFATGRTGGAHNARMHATIHKNTRIVWADFSPNSITTLSPIRQRQLESVIAGILRYSTNQEYWSIASWPEARRYAAFIAQDSNRKLSKDDKVASFFNDNQYPVTHYLPGDSLKIGSSKNALWEFTEFACSEKHLNKLSNCATTVKSSTGQTNVGFKVSLEQSSQVMQSAGFDIGMQYVFTDDKTPTMTPHIKTIEGSDQHLVVIPSDGSDGQYLWSTLDLNARDSLSKVLDELSWVEHTGTLFGFGFQKEYMHEDQRFEVVQTLAHTVGNDSLIWMDNVGNIAQWWSFRHKLLTGASVTSKQVARFKPVKISVNSSGELKMSWFRPTTTDESSAVVATQDSD